MLICLPPYQIFPAQVRLHVSGLADFLSLCLAQQQLPVWMVVVMVVVVIPAPCRLMHCRRPDISVTLRHEAVRNNVPTRQLCYCDQRGAKLSFDHKADGQTGCPKAPLKYLLLLVQVILLNICCGNPLESTTCDSSPASGCMKAAAYYRTAGALCGLGSCCASLVLKCNRSR